MKFLFLILVYFFLILEVISWPGDQDSLSCIPEQDYNNPRNRNDIKAQYSSTGSFATTDEAKKIQNQKDAIERVKTIVRNNHDMNFRVTKLGDSLSDLVDFYGVAIPRNIFPNYGDAAGTFGRISIFMDSWTDYMTAGAGILDPNAKLNFQNFGVSGFQTTSVMTTLGINIDGTREDWTVNKDSPRCVRTRPMATGMVPVDYYEAITKEQSSLRSTLMAGGNDIIQSGLGFNGWLPFLNRYQVDSTLLNIMAITDWHLENGKQIFLEGTLPVLSHPARNPYDTVLINRQTLCRPLNDLLVDLNEIPWYAAFIPGMMTSIIKWNEHVISEVTKFLSDIYNPPPKPNTSSPGGFVNSANQALDTQLDKLLDEYLEFTANNNLVLSDAQKAELKRQIFERRTSPDNQYNDTPTRILFTSASIAQACVNDRIKNNLLPLYKQSFPKNVDGYPLYSNFNKTGDIPYASNFWVPEDIVFRQTGIFFQGSGFWDAIHIGPEGYKRWGIQNCRSWLSYSWRPKQYSR
ncbi:MAG TPA: hypothetical protein PK079_10785 [Leptospiraceae bacterium]|nr:hypothetical protein [Leptospiraceae bacterium]HMW05881.1 hypothetical protein [Leptospiraceae bacterium]HMY32754.1 hypothetical protein [Leptospiraceae bacterium]HMZ62561.1 hypothetical protein [Leptospiraceae bacterium]HNA05794.1 hypothetical protein [Leptospiraceae bacterium]